MPLSSDRVAVERSIVEVLRWGDIRCINLELPRNPASGRNEDSKYNTRDYRVERWARL
jgi:hypothetical protein